MLGQQERVCIAASSDQGDQDCVPGRRAAEAGGEGRGARGEGPGERDQSLLDLLNTTEGQGPTHTQCWTLYILIFNET